MNCEYFFSIVKKFNILMKEAINGPNCLDPNICKGDCCSIKIDVPKKLAKEYVKRGCARKEDFIRSDVFAFHLRIDVKNTIKCFLFDKSINGCRVHDTGIKPPQCWIYPTDFSNPENKEISCKKAAGWKIIDQKKAKEAEKLLQKYVFLCQLEAKKELKNVNKRIGKQSSKNLKNKINNLKKELKKIAPSQLGGFKDGWDFFTILSAEGLSLQMKKFCFKSNKECKFFPDDFLGCKSICDIVANRLIKLLQENILNYIKEKGADTDGEYPLYKLFKFIKKKEN